MKFGLWYAGVGPLAQPAPAAVVARAAETARFESLWTGDHIVTPVEYESRYPYSSSGRMATSGPVPMAEVLVWAGYLAVVTSSIRLATGVLVVPQREPVLLAKQAATVATMSRSRFTLGVGAGWLREEFDAVGADFANRGARLDDYITAMRSLWAHDVADHDSEFVSFSGAQLCPRPPDGTIPIVVGGDSRAAARRAGRLGDGWFPAKVDRAGLPAAVAVMAESAEAARRNPDEVEITVSDSSVWQIDGALATVEAWARLGVSRIIVSPPTLDVSQLTELLARFGSEVIDHANGQ